jgi:hypothetical protein
MNTLGLIWGLLRVFFAVFTLMDVINTRRLRRLARQRLGDSICSFARSLDYRRLDTKVIRAVYEGMQDNLARVCPAFPVRPSDDIDQVYRVDPEDYEDFVVKIADRVGRSLEDYGRNPYYHHTSTIAGLIEFLCAQPKVQPA